MSADMQDVELTTAERAGFVNAHIKDNGGAYCFALSEVDALLDAWTNGRPFFTGEGYTGARTTVKLALVEGVTVWTPEANAQSEVNAAELRDRERQRRLVEGEV